MLDEQSIDIDSINVRMRVVMLEKLVKIAAHSYNDKKTT
jgi:hypothetical protein